MPSGIYKHKKGTIPWNKGLTKEISQSLMLVSQKKAYCHCGKGPHEKPMANCSTKHRERYDFYRHQVIAKRRGITIEEVKTLWRRPCAICGKIRGVGIDHSHKTGAIRGVLCSPCNLLVGLIEKSLTKIAKKAVEYLEKFT